MDLTDKIFGKLIVVDRSGRVNKHRQPLWYCLCECGGFCYATSSVLKQGKTSCGCSRARYGKAKLFKDLTGKKFGRWTVTDKLPARDKYRKTFWRCVCECGSVKPVSSSSLLRGNSRSCGCLRREVNSELRRKRNDMKKILSKST